MGSLMCACEKLVAATQPSSTPTPNRGLEKAEWYLKEMKRRKLTPDVVAYSSLIEICARSGVLSRAEELFKEMQRAKIEPNVVTFNSLMLAFFREKHFSRVIELFDEMKKRGVKPNALTYSTRIGSCESMRAAVEVFKEMQQSSSYTFDASILEALIEVCRRSGDHAIADKLAKQGESLLNRTRNGTGIMDEEEINTGASTMSRGRDTRSNSSKNTKNSNPVARSDSPITTSNTYIPSY